MGWSLYKQLSDNKAHFNDWAAAVKELISTSSGVTLTGNYFKMENIKVKLGAP